ncbi:3,4-dihydroxy-2-butanone 4-phosphate synthase [Pseudogymnoascus sp. 03VT05]|nr:3,4-dihydroxy-2-butanone 4-phosphate synthase [Pseudogymnoascus sp. 03VT05]
MPSSVAVAGGADQFDSIEDAIAAFKNGEFVVVLDDPGRENEGDLIIAAEDVTPEQMAFMVRYSSGLICAPLVPELCVDLGLPQMVVNNEDPKSTAYTLSIDANHPTTTTGISAQDRALTCRMLGSKGAKKEDFRRPGHVFPLQAREGLVRQRPGHTEATVEFCRLAGKQLVGICCELVEDGEVVEGKALRKEPGMMRTEGCLAFGKKWGLTVVTIEALVAYVEKREGKYKNGSN